MKHKINWTQEGYYQPKEYKKTTVYNHVPYYEKTDQSVYIDERGLLTFDHVVGDLTTSGTLYTQHDTTLSHLAHHIKLLDIRYSRMNHTPLFPSFARTITNLVENTLRENKAQPTQATADQFCSTVNILSKNFLWSWLNQFDLMIHDAAVTYAYKHTDTAANLSCKLWVYSRQFRADKAKYETLERHGLLDQWDKDTLYYQENGR